MSLEPIGRAPLRFGVFVLNADAGELRRDGLQLHLPDQPLQVLLALLKSPGEIVTRDELRTLLWPEGTYVEFDDSLNAAIARLRQALGDSAENPRFIQTVPRRGYRFIAPVASSLDAATSMVEAAPAGPVGGLRVPWAAAGLAVVVVAGLLAGWWWRRLRAAEATPRVQHTTPLTTAPGIEYQPCWSPDGTRVAYASDQSGNFDILVRQVGTEATVALTTDGSHHGSPAWSPNGAWIAFASTRDGGGIDVIPAVGGAVHRIADLPYTPSFDLLGSVPTLAWSPRGDTIALGHGVEGRTGLYLVPASGGVPREVPLGAKGFSIVQPSWSPDGGRIAFAALTGSLHTRSRLWTVRADGSDPRPVTDGTHEDLQPVWSSDGRWIFFLSDRGGTLDVWLVKVDGEGHPRTAPVPVTAGVGIGSFALARDGRRLAYSKVAERSNIWALPLPGPGKLAWSDARPVTTENHTLEFLDISRDGRRLVFDSDRGGSMDIWTMNVDGSELRQVTADGADDWHPSLSPDGREVVFHSVRDGNREIYVARLAGGATRRLTEHPAKDWLPRWSPAGPLIAFNSDRRGNQDVFVISSNGGEPRALTTENSNDHNPIWSPDGRTLAFASNREGPDEVYLVPREGGAAPRLTRQGWEDVVPCLWSRYDGLIYAWARGGGHLPSYWVIRPDDGRARPILEGGLSSRQLGIAMATDGARLLFPVWERLSDIWVADLAADGNE
jgi:Tol biopolymer transport system component/DNA-binding winged helix-turn-helix (wHTH) protein